MNTAWNLQALPDGRFQAEVAARPGFARMFGGQLVAQALHACSRTVSDQFAVHSLHAYFLRGGDVVEPVEYEVQNMRDGRTLSVRQAVGSQDGVRTLVLNASFHAPEPGIEHQLPAPEPFDVDQGPDYDALMAAADPGSALWLQSLRSLFPFQIRYAAPPPRLAVRRGATAPARQQVFLRWPDLAGAPPVQQTLALSYQSDALLLSTALFPHGRLLDSADVRASSLDHAIWFHQATDLSQWHLYRMESDRASDGRALCSGRLFSSDGRLVATVAQEGLVRIS